jgi:transcriptional regulator with XRE-family HTH domain
MAIRNTIEALRLPAPLVRRALRLAAGMTLAEVGEVVGVTRSAVSRWERDARQPRGDRRLRYAAVLRELREVVAHGD